MTAEEIVVRSLRLHEKLFLALLFGWAACGPMACASAPPSPVAHDAVACSASCPLATVVEVAPNGAMCRCAAPGLTYTFNFPDSAAAVERWRSRWTSGLDTIARCKAQGLAWETSPDGSALVCVKPDTPAAVDPNRHASLPWDFPPPHFIQAHRRARRRPV